MAEWHLMELREALERRGWRFAAEHPGDGYRISAIREFVPDAGESILIDFGGLDDLNTLPIREELRLHAQNRAAGRTLFFEKGRQALQQPNEVASGT